MPLLDIHTHHPAPQPEAIISIPAGEFSPAEDQFYSVGIHPWDTMAAPTEEFWKALETAASRPDVLAIGECGVDTLKGGPMFRQLQVLKRQIELSERLGKPLIIHDVKAHDVITGLRRDLMPTQPWVIHGFRGKPTVAKMLTDAGMYLSFGEKFNAESLQQTPADRILAETDESSLSITEIITVLSTAAGRDLTEEIASNTRAVLHL